jgi:chromosome partitioning protein
MAKIVTVAIHKGGTGKTTMAVNLAFLAAERGAKTLMVDLDPQKNGTTTVVDPNKTDFEQVRQTADLFEDAEPTKPILAASETLHLLVADERLFGVERLPFEAVELFGRRLLELAAQYDLIVVDTPPTMGFGMLAPLLVSDFAFAPVMPNRYSTDGLETLIVKVNEVKGGTNPKLNFLGILINKWRKTSPAQNRMVKQLRKELGDFMMPQSLPDSSAIEESANERRPAWHEVKGGTHRRAAKAIREVLGGILDQILGVQNAPKTATAPAKKGVVARLRSRFQKSSARAARI